jgi:hypothetical protein
VTSGWQFDEAHSERVRRAIAAGDSEIAGLVRQATELAVVRYPEPAAEAAGRSSGYNEKRLSDRILRALELALDQSDLAASEHLEKAFEAVMTRFGGPNVVEKRDMPEAMLRIYERLTELRHRRLRP